MKVLLSAYFCHPEKGSEQGVGWNWLKEIAKCNKVFILFYEEQGQKEAVEKAVCLLPQKSNIKLFPISVPKFFHGRLYRIRYEIWQIKAFFIAKKIVKNENIDLIHHVSIAAWWFTGYYHKLKIPFLLGPILGGQKCNKYFLKYLPIKNQFYEIIRKIIINEFAVLNIKAIRAIRNSSMILCGNNETASFIKKYTNTEIVLMTSTGINNRVNYSKRSGTSGEITYLWSGRLVTLKNFLFLLKVLRKLPIDLKWKLIVMGDGPKRKEYEKKVIKFSLQEHIQFMGHIPYSKTSEFYQKSDILLFPSIREGSPSVILEAMLHGLPVIAFKQNGADLMINKMCGILIPIISSTQILNDFLNAIILLSNNSQLRLRLGMNAIEEVIKDYGWENRREKMIEYYKKFYVSN